MPSTNALHGAKSSELLPVSSYLHKNESKLVQRSKLLEIIRKRIHLIQSHYHEDLAELSFIQAGSRLIDFPPWLRRRSHELMLALCSGHLDSEDLILIGSFMSGVTYPDKFFPPTLSNFQSAGNPSLGDDDSDEDEDRLLDETSIYRIAADEVNILKRVADLRRAGVWYGGSEEGVGEGTELGLSATPSMSSLAPPSETVDRVYKDYLFAELQWLAEDYKRERQWKKVSARKLAIAAVKSHREKTKGFLRAEREEVLRIRKVCASIARMVRDWWRQMDKIVHAKQQARLTVKQQQAITSHLESVLETTEEYTRWLTEDIAGTQVESVVSQSATESEVPMDNETNGNRSSESSDEASEEVDTHGEITTLDNNSETDRLVTNASEMVEDSDGEYKLEKNDLETDDDDEETITREEELAAKEQQSEKPPAKVELAQLAAEADCPLEDLLPPDYFEQLCTTFASSEPSSSLSAVAEPSEEKEDTSKPADTNDNDDDDDCDIMAADASAKQLVQAALEAADKSDQPMSIEVVDSATASVAIPFLLSGGTLREYQIVGLTWLATIYNKRLNGILADEMGLGKTIQTIALLAHLACERSIWGPHLIVVPTSVMLNWEMEFKRWCPGFKIITYFGGVKERRERRKGWTKTNAFHVCITSYRLAIQDANVFKRKKWKYLILDEAQNIKNFKSQRWQTLLNFNSQRRLLLTGTPLQNSLMELWSLMHFLMPNIFQSHRDFQEWFASPLTGMMEGNREFNEQLVERLHKVLRPFLLRRLKADVERQLPKKFEHVIMCRLSRRQRFLYDDFMSRSSTCEVLSTGQFLSVMNVLMQLRKVCNHPNLFETRPIVSPFHINEHLLAFPLPRLLVSVSYPFLLLPSTRDTRHGVAGVSAQLLPDLDWLDRAGRAARLLGQQANLVEMARDLPSFVRTRCQQLAARRSLITAVDGVELTDDDKEYYPRLLEPCTIPPTVTKVTPAVRSCDSGMPKAVLRSRTVERQKTLSLLSRLNDRRCHIWTRQLNHPNQQPARHTKSWGDESQLGPDVMHCITRMIRQPSSVTSSLTRYPGLVSGHSVCQHSLVGLFLRESTTGRYVRDWKGAASTSRLSHSLGPEAPYGSPDWCHWRLSCFPLRQLLYTPTDRLNQMGEELNRYTFIVPSVISSGFSVDTSHCYYQSQRALQSDRLQELFASLCPTWLASRFLRLLEDEAVTASGRMRDINKSNPLVPLTPLSWLVPYQLHKIGTACRIQFPDPRLIQYDCGKLQRLNLLLQELKAGNHRILIFSQMARMLDILEQFLAYHGHPYLRLDGTTKVEQRQVLMERFNQDTQIFVFILSTRSGGLGVNLTGADTVIFYDSDWNPTMDAQAQDRCHRIGQTRDVHIYRLISEMTVEENILRKANQKRFLSDVAIEGGRFTTAFFKQNTISELFAEPTGLQRLKSTLPSFVHPHRVQDLASKDAETKDFQPPAKESDVADSVSVSQSKEVDFSALLEVCEEENDRMATKQALNEAKADLAEFDESIPFDSVVGGATDPNDTVDPLTRFAMTKQQQKSGVDNQSGNGTVSDNPTQLAVEQQLSEFDAALRPIERFGVRMVEEDYGGSLAEQLEMADAHHAESERTWRLDQLKALHEADEGKAEVEEDDILYCYGDYDPTAQMAELARLDRIIAAEEEELQQQELRERQKERQQREERRRQQAKHGLNSKYHHHRDQAESPSQTPLSFDNNHNTTSDSEPTGVTSGCKVVLAAEKRPRYSFASDHEDDDMDNIFTQSSPSDIDEEQAPRLSLDRPRKISSKYRYLPPSRTDRDIFAVNNHSVINRKRPFASTVPTGQSKHPRGDGYRRPRGRPRLHGQSSFRKLEEFSERDSMSPSLTGGQVYTPRPLHTNRQSCEKDSLDYRTDRAGAYRYGRHFDIPGRPASTRQPGHGLPPSIGLFRGPLSNWTASSKRTSHTALGAGHPSHRNLHQSTAACPQDIRPGHLHVNSALSDNIICPRPATIQEVPPTVTQRPSEPCIPLQSISNGTHFSLQASHLLSTSGQPVFVITRQMKTPTGEVYHQRFTHPVAPPTQFTRVVHRLVQPVHTPSTIPSVPFTPPCLSHNGWIARPVQTPPQPTMAARPTALFTSASQPLANVRNLPVMRVEQSSVVTTPACRQLPVSVSIQPVAANPRTPSIPVTTTVTTSHGAPSVGNPMIRMISCDSTSGNTPFVQLAPVETSPPGTSPITTVVLARPPLLLATGSSDTATATTDTTSVATIPHVIRLRRILPTKPVT